MHLKRPLLVAALALAALAPLVTAQNQPTARSPRFAQLVTDHFDAWDKDHNGKLSPEEIDAACVNQSIKGPEAAAVATLKRIVRSGTYELPPLTKEFLTKPSSGATGTSHGPQHDADREDSGEGVKLSAAQHPPDWQARYQQCLSRILRSDHQLFAVSGPLTIEHCHQGPLGDCYFVSVVGAEVYRDAAAVRRMISPLPGSEAGYSVTFGNNRKVKVSPLTDAEVAISSTTDDRGGDEGLWLAVLEKAFGTMRRDDHPERYSAESATDAIAKGGSTATSIRLLTGHTTERIAFKRRPPSTSTRPVQIGPDGKPIQPDSTPTPTPTPSGHPGSTPGPSLVLAGDADKLAAKVRESVSKALAAKRLVAAGTADEKQPPGISPKHAYAVLAFDAAKDSLTIWNPHGNTYRPRGPAGLEYGYPTKAGVFELPVKDAIRIFQGLTIETEKSAGNSTG